MIVNHHESCILGSSMHCHSCFLGPGQYLQHSKWDWCTYFSDDSLPKNQLHWNCVAGRWCTFSRPETTRMCKTSGGASHLWMALWRLARQWFYSEQSRLWLDLPCQCNVSCNNFKYCYCQDTLTQCLEGRKPGHSIYSNINAFYPHTN